MYARGNLDAFWTENVFEIKAPRIELSEPGHSHPVLRCSGELDLAVAEPLRQALEAACAREIEALLLDFADVELLDARVLGLLDWTRARLEARGVPLRIVAGGQPLRLLRQTGMDERIPTLGCRGRSERHRPRGGAEEAPAPGGRIDCIRARPLRPPAHLGPAPRGRME